MRVFFNIIIFCLGISAVTGIQAQALEPHAQEFKRAVLDIKGQKLSVEYADTWDLRAQGLMYRTELCDQCGMLFKFDKERMISMWMKNTLIPLDVAFFKKDGKIINIKQMQPLDLTSVPSSEPVYYALEMNQGWFAKNQIQEGDSILVLQTGKQSEFAN